jgi:hypothetical protein
LPKKYLNDIDIQSSFEEVERYEVGRKCKSKKYIKLYFDSFEKILLNVGFLKKI